MAGRVLPLFASRGKAKSLDSDITATTRRAIDVWLRDIAAGSRAADRASASEIRLALRSGYVPSRAAFEWLRRRAKNERRECGWLARAALEELER